MEILTLSGRSTTQSDKIWAGNLLYFAIRFRRHIIQAITDAAFVLTLETMTHSELIRLLGCVLFLQSTLQQSWILLSAYHNRSGNLRAAVTTRVQDNILYNILYLLQCYKSSKYWLYIVIYNNT